MTSKNRLPEFLASGEKARLIPVVSDGSRESRATSILLATLSAVHEFSQTMLAAAGEKVGARSSIEVYTEVVFADKNGKAKLRPDGLIIINRGKKQWKALVEAKIGNSDLNAEQIKDYCELAKRFKIDAVITVSNQYSALPTHHPIEFKKSDLKGVALYHWSWMLVLTEAILLLKSMGVEDEDQKFILSEMVRYYDHDKVGVSSFTRMNAEWKDVALKVRSGSRLTKTSDEVKNTVASWHQEARDLCLILTRKIAVPVSLKLKQKHKKNPNDRLKDDCEELVSTHILSAELDIPDAAAPLCVSADLTRRTVTCSMRLDAPKDKQKSSARLNWLLRQLKQVDAQDVYIKSIAQGKRNNLQAPLSQVTADGRVILLSDGVEIQVNAFEVMIVKDLAGKFSGRSTFIEAVEVTVRLFYEAIGQNIQAWAPSAPKVKAVKDEIPEIDEPVVGLSVVEQDDTDSVHEKLGS